MGCNPGESGCRSRADRADGQGRIFHATGSSIFQEISPGPRGAHTLLGHAYIWPLAFIPLLAFVALVIVGSSNAVNLTDGLDGLAIGCTVIAAGAFTVLTYLISNARFSTYLEIPYIPHAAELTVFCGALVGASMGFLWYNAHPADVFMGDVGSLSLGRHDRRTRGDFEAGSVAVFRWRSIRLRGGVCNFTSCLFPAYRQANFPHGAAASPF